MIYFIRHGQTNFNKLGKVHGQIDEPLNDDGINQAFQMQKDVDKIDFDLIYCSPLKRARKTAEILNQNKGVPIIYDDRLKEVFAGNMQGQVFLDFPLEIRNQYFAHPEDFGGESHEALENRVWQVYSEISALGKNVLIVSHGVVGKIILEKLGINKKFKGQIPVPGNCEIIILKDDKIENKEKIHNF